MSLNFELFDWKKWYLLLALYFFDFLLHLNDRGRVLVQRLVLLGDQAVLIALQTFVFFSQNLNGQHMLCFNATLACLQFGSCSSICLLSEKWRFGTVLHAARTFGR